MNEERMDMLSAMYAQDENDETTGPRPQPEQLRLAGKATLIPHKEGHLAVPRIEYVDSLVKMINDLSTRVEEQTRRIKRLEARLGANANIANRRMAAVEAEMRERTNPRRWE